jgi:hypothetical protein
LFADDTSLFYSAKDLNHNITELNSSLTEVLDWCNRNKLTLNIDKTHYILIKNYQNKFSLVNDVKMGETVLSEVDSIKFLGVTLDKTLNWSIHINNLRLQILKVSGLIYHVSSFMPTSVLITLYNALVNSKIVYCLEAWGNAPESYLSKILAIQKRILRTIYKKGPREHAYPLFKRAQILPIHALYSQRISILAHHEYYHPSVPRISPNYNTRHSHLSLPLPPSTSSCGHRQVAYQIADVWGRLPQSIRAIECLRGFKVNLKRHLLLLWNSVLLS